MCLPLKHECGTRTLFGKPYHWRVVDGMYTLLAGRDPDDVTAEAFDQHAYPGFADEATFDTSEAADG